MIMIIKLTLPYVKAKLHLPMHRLRVLIIGTLSLLGLSVQMLCLPLLHAVPSIHHHCILCYEHYYHNYYFKFDYYFQYYKHTTIIIITNLYSLFLACAIGSYLLNYLCTPCLTGYTTAATGGTSISQCNVCDIGYYGSGGTCTQCSSGKTTLTAGATSSAQCGMSLLASLLSSLILL